MPTHRRTFRRTMISLLATVGLAALLGVMMLDLLQTSVTSAAPANWAPEEESHPVRDAARIVVAKETIPLSSSQTFSFSLTGPSTSQQFILAHGDPPFDSGELLPGTYAVNEQIPAGWIQANAACTDGQQTYSPDDIGLQASATITCSFTNEQQGRITVDKVTDPPGSNQTFNFTLTGPDVIQEFVLTDVDLPYDSGYLNAASYSVVEGPVNGWGFLDSATCSDGDNLYEAEDINLLPGGTVNCEFFNRQPPLSVVVTKTVGIDPNTCGTFEELEASAGTDVYFCFSLQNTGGITFTEHSLIDASLNVTLSFDYLLEPGDLLHVTNGWLGSQGLPAALGPIEVTEDIVNTVSYGASNGVVFTQDLSTARVILKPSALDDDVFPERFWLNLPQVSR
jgi:hypothetical protein